MQKRIKYHNSELTEQARKQRLKMSKYERHLWYDYLRNYEVKFYRQRVIGNFIADFYCAKARLIVQLDPSDGSEDDVMNYDEQTVMLVRQMRLAVLRFAQRDVYRRFEEVCERIDECVKERIRTERESVSNVKK